MTESSPHRYTHPASPPASRGSLTVNPSTTGPGRLDLLAGHGLELGALVELEVPASGGNGFPRLVRGTVEAALDNVLVVASPGGVTNRVRWGAITIIRDQPPTHPANQ